jgi:hypothetical protein
MPKDGFVTEYAVLEFFQTLLIFSARRIKTTDGLSAHIERCEKSECLAEVPKCGAWTAPLFRR